MTSEALGTPKQWYDTANIIGSRDTFPADGALYNICTQTGEEFSAEFLRDRVVTQRTQPSRTDLDHQLPKRVVHNLNHNHHMPYEHLNRILGLQKVSSGRGSNAIGFVPREKYVAEAEKRCYPINISRHSREHGSGNGQLSSKFANDIDWFSLGRGSPPVHAVESPLSYQHPGRGSLGQISSSGKIKFLCSFGGRILPRPCDGKLRYVGGETRILSFDRNINFEELTRKTSAIWNQHHTIKYQLPGEDLDALISVCSSEDLNLMIEEYQELERTEGSQRLRIFLISASEPGSPASIDRRGSQPIDADFQYVVAVNGMLSSPRKSSSGHSLTSQTSQFGNASDCSPSFRRETPTTAHVPQVLTPFQLSGKSFNQSPPFSPVYLQQKDSKHIHTPFYANASPYDYNESFYPSVLENIPNENSASMENNENIDATGHFNNNLTQGTSSMNYHSPNPYLTEVDQNNQPFDIAYQNRSPNSEVASSACGQFDLTSESSIAKEWPFHSDMPEEQANFFLGSSDRDECCSKVEQSLPELFWQGKDERSSSHGTGKGLTESSLNIWKPKSPSKAMSSASPDWLLQFLETVDVKVQDNLHENAPSCIRTDNYRSEFHQDVGNMHKTDEKKHWSDESSGNFQNNKEIKYAQDTYLPSDILPLPTEIERPEHEVSHSFEFLEESLRNLMEQSHGFPLERRNSNISTKGQNSVGDARSGLRGSDELALRRSDFLPVAFNTDQEKMLSASEAVSYAEKREAANYEKPSLFLENKNCIPSGVPSPLKVICHEDYDVDSEPPSLDQVDMDSLSAEFESEVAKDTGKGSDRPIGDPELVEIEAGIYGLQTIKNADLEELNELGSGTFGTVYHGKWRGTDVAIKRIKSSCFSGKSSEQEHLIKDFWREARLLSTLHHPNVVAFYGIVPDVPEGTLATVTEYMVNGSLRNVLLTKKVVLDQRKRLMIAMDAAFGMEYLHLKNIVHLDLKCDNLLVNLRDPERPICKVGDFDLSKIKHSTLVSGGVRGTLPWMAPELLNGSSSKVSEKVDVFSFGITMWEILTGEEPYANMHCGAIIGGIVNNTLRPSIPKRCDAEWKKLMEDCWSADPSARPSFTEITNRLRNMSAALKKKSPNVAIR